MLFIIKLSSPLNLLPLAFIFTAFTGLSPVLAAPLVNFTVSLNTSHDAGATYTNFVAGGSGSQSRFTIGFQLTLHNIDGTPVNVGPIAAFCSEIAEPISAQNYTFAAAPLKEIASGQAGISASASAAIPVGGIGDLRAARVAYLFDQFYISDQLTAWTVTTAQPSTQAFQLALWELTHDSDLSLSNTSGAVYLGSQGTSTLRNNGVSLAQSYLDTVNTANIDGTYVSTKFKIWALVDANGAGSTGWQDVIVAVPLGSSAETMLTPLLPVAPIPEPGTVAFILLALGLFLLGRKGSKR